MARFASPLEPGRAVASPAAVAGDPESPLPDPGGSVDAPPGSSRPAAHKANESRRDALLRMVKSLETEQIKDRGDPVRRRHLRRRGGRRGFLG